MVRVVLLIKLSVGPLADGRLTEVGVAATILRIDSHKPMLITALLATNSGTFTGRLSELAKSV